ncbi:3',5'-cyclic-nucleotide phosphodiesterase [Halomonas sp. IOP_14]|uniref:3',5'-cyclic-nucleotide phosphodiesterase n=1 Tax=Halomonas sp. IOP_14 TaxID=2873295 RepID=UPI001E4F1496|nr:3',5'-cyclic-nucleotide phosphodiesterase [Halomonas sp. IOP_14]MCD1585617.1 3',5'-cyclic-nucleotide phosphodiesterase [Halomonas sp. IOP_14]
MKINPLGASGGLEQSQGTSAFLLTPSTLLDAGTGLNRLSDEQIRGVEKVLLTHAHIDHIASLPLLVDSLFEPLISRHHALTVYALPDVIKSLQTHIFNDIIWPDFTQLPSAEHPVLQYIPLDFWQTYTLDETLSVMPFPVTHGVPACGYWIGSANNALAFSGDTGLSSTIVQSIDRLGKLDTLVIECAFPDQLDHLAESSHHLTPQRLAHLLSQLAIRPKAVHITHLKPAHRDTIIQQLHDMLPTSLAWQTIP